MTAVLLRLAIGSVRAWTRTYTWSLPEAPRDARRAEVESDLWESAHDPEMPAGSLICQMLVRLVAGMPDDLQWRFETNSANRARRMAFLAGAAGILALLLIFILVSARQPSLPELPELALHERILLGRHPHGPPPPPPPPPCAPPGFPGRQTDCTK
jgi:hypothetical protein